MTIFNRTDGGETAHRISRRKVLLGGASAAAMLVARPSLAAATPGCADGTEDNPLGPAYLPGAPERDQPVDFVEAGMPDNWTRLTLAGRVMSTACVPIAGALLDFWQANGNGEYSSPSLYSFRGKLRSNEQGKYEIRTVVPGAYQLRTKHLHFIVSAAGFVELTTQLYFAGDPGNSQDPWYCDDLALETHPYSSHGLAARFDFVLTPT